MRLLVLLLGVALFGCREHKYTVKKVEPKVLERASAKANPVKAPQAPTLEQRLVASPTLADGIGVMTPAFADKKDGLDPATAAFAFWLANRYKESIGTLWTEIQALPETKRALVMKDPEPERGKRLCTSGSVVQITADRSAGLVLYEGALMTPSSDFIRFISVGSSGELVDNSPARFCGVVTGIYSYANAAGGTTHSVRAVGVFDLPENKSPKQPGAAQ